MKKQRFASVWGCDRAFARDGYQYEGADQADNCAPRGADSWKVTQTVAAKKLGLTQPRMNDLLRGRVNKFSLDALINIAARTGLSVRVEVRKAA